MWLHNHTLKISFVDQIKNKIGCPIEQTVHVLCRQYPPKSHVRDPVKRDYWYLWATAAVCGSSETSRH